MALLKNFAAIAVLSATAAFGDSGHSDWPKYCANLAMTGVAQGAANLSPATARFLNQLWKVKLNGPIASQPTIVNGIVYIGDWSGTEWALDAATGIPLAHANLGTTTAPQCDPSTIGITSSAAVSSNIVYVAGGDDAFYALDATTLAVVWRRSLGDNSKTGGYYGWCSPAIAAGEILQGISSNCDDPFVPGRLMALNISDGSDNNISWMIEPEWPNNALGGGIWTSPAVDEAKGDVFVTTGSANDINDGNAFSILRLDLYTLVIQEAWKIEVSDPISDSDWGTSPTLFTDSRGREMVGAGQKDGNYYAFARHGLGQGPAWKRQLANGGTCPLCADGVLSTAAFDGRRLYVGSGRPPDADDNVIGAVNALNPNDGSIVWRYPLAAPVIAPVSYANGVVFTTAGTNAIALDAATGALLWKGNTKAMCVGGVAITDRGIVFGDLAGNLYAYAIPPDAPVRGRSASH